MATVHPELTDEQRQALDAAQGFYRGPNYVLMTVDAYRDTLGQVATERADTLRAIEQGLADIEAGRTISLEEFKRRFEAKYGAPG